MITDNACDLPSDQFLITTRQWWLIHHAYPDVRHWAFSGGETLVRIQSTDGNYTEAFIFAQQSPILDYWTQRSTGYENIEHILATH